MRTAVKNACAAACLVLPFAARFQYGPALWLWLACFVTYAALSGAYSLKKAYGDDDDDDE